ncbi:hypothetical protein INR49_007710 [Caranx melampygus]|nr:hypothetical protein INR49_007710 [Caranx melampygus]
MLSRPVVGSSNKITPATASQQRILTRVLKELAGDRNPSPLTPGDPWENTSSDNTVGHMSQAQLGHHCQHLHRSHRSKVRPDIKFSLGKPLPDSVGDALDTQTTGGL